MKIKFGILSITILTVILGCSDSATTPSNDIVFPDKDVSYSSHVQPVFYLRCATSGCHDDQSRAGDISLTSYFNLTARPGIVIAGNSKASLLAQKIDGRLPHSNPIPILINSNQINGIKKWIDEGAKNN